MLILQVSPVEGDQRILRKGIFLMCVKLKTGRISLMSNKPACARQGLTIYDLRFNKIKRKLFILSASLFMAGNIIKLIGIH